MPDAVDVGVVQQQQDENTQIGRRGSGTDNSVQALLLVHLRANRHMICILISIFAYFASVVVVYSNIEGWDFMECIYFALVVVTTVGYGDYLPTSYGSKIATIILCHFALAIVGFAIHHIVDGLNRKFYEMLKAHEDGIGVFDSDTARRRRQCKTLVALLLYVGVLMCGTFVFAFGVDWEEHSDSKFLNGLYLTVITVTTIGFGDFSPAGHPGLQVFGCFLMIFGVPTAVTVFTLTTEIIFGEMEDEVNLKLIKDEMTKTKFESLSHFVDEMRADGVGNYRNQGHDNISRFEYLCFVLVKNKVVTLQNIEGVMKNFDGLDHTHSGFICPEDVHDPELRKLAQVYDVSTVDGELRLEPLEDGCSLPGSVPPACETSQHLCPPSRRE